MNLNPPDHWPTTGECVLRSMFDGGGLWVLQADPLILMSGDLVRRMWAVPPSGTYADRITCNLDVITVRADNQTVVYRLVEYAPPPRDYWLAQWPD